MSPLQRREFVGILGGALGIAIAGCSDEGGEFLVTNTRLIIEQPASIRVRVTIENNTAQRQEGTLEIRLAYHADGDTESSPDETWRKSDQVSIKRSSSALLNYTFQSVHREGTDETNYTAEASIDADDG